MIVEFCKDTKKRKCGVCSRNIKKGSVLVKYEKVIDNWKNTRMRFYHISCLNKKLKKLEQELKNTIPKTKYEV